MSCRSIPAKKTPDGVRAVVKDKPVDPAKVERYFEQKFGDDLERVRDYEKRTRHDVMAHLEAFADRAPAARPILHLGATSCSTGVPCTAAYFTVFGFVTIPYMALSGFLLILALLWIDRANSAEPQASLPNA